MRRRRSADHRLFQVDQGTSATTTKFITDGDAMVLEYNGSNVVTNRYAHGSNAAADDPLVWYSGSDLSTAHWLHADHLGSIVAITNGTGANSTINSYDEYGINGTGNSTSERFGYTGQAYISQLGLYYYKARMYSPSLGRFLQTDPIGYKDQINLYEYVANDPVNGRDPTGKDEVYIYNGMIVVVAQVHNGTGGAITDQQLNAQVSRSSGTTSDGTKLVVSATSAPSGPGVVEVSVDPSKDAYTTGKTATTDRIGGYNIKMAPNEPTDKRNYGHEFGHHFGAGDQYAGGRDKDGGVVGSTIPGPTNMMRDSIGSSNQQTTTEQVNHVLTAADDHVQTCSVTVFITSCR